MGKPNKSDSLDITKPRLDKFIQELTELGQGISFEDLTARKYIGELQVPLAIHHARGDGSTGSLELAARLYMAKREYQLFLYDSDDHLFSGDDFKQAIGRDLAWFKAHSK